MSELQFPVSIGLVGAPGAGKQAVAERLKEISVGWFAENDSTFSIVENPGTTIEGYDQAMGLFGSYAEDLRAYSVRYEAEQALRRQGVSFISLGTVLDNIAHCGINLENIMTGLQTPDQEQRMQRQQVTMTMLTFLFMERFQYLFGFYLPYESTSIVLPGQPEPSNYPNRIDMALRTILSNFGLRIQVLDQPTVEEKAQEIFDTVKRIMEFGPELPPQDAEPSSETDAAVPVPAGESVTLAE